MRKLVISEVIPTKWGPEQKQNRHLVKPLNEIAEIQRSMANFIKKITPELSKIPEDSRKSIHQVFSTIFNKILGPMIKVLKEYSSQKTSSMQFLSSLQIESLLKGMLKGNTKRVSYLKIISRYLDPSFSNMVNSWLEKANKLTSSVAQARTVIPPERYQTLKEFCAQLIDLLRYLQKAVNI